MIRTVPYPEQLAAVEREIKQRERVYPRLVSSGRMTQALADLELERMRAVKRTLELVVALDRDLVEKAEKCARGEAGFADVGSFEESIDATLDQLREEGRPAGGEQRSLL